MKRDLEEVWRGLSSPVRRNILDLLRGGPKTTGAIAERFPELSRYAVMQHLDVLVESRLVLMRREGRNRYNYLNPVPLRLLYERWVSYHADEAATIALAVKSFAERPNCATEGDKMAEDPSQRDAGRIVKVETEVAIAASPERVFDAITIEFDAWWPHRFKPNGKMVFEPRVSGRCYEDWGDEGGAHHGIIVWWEPKKKFAATGPGVMYRGFDCYDVQSVMPDPDVSGGCIYRKSVTFWGDVPDDVVRMIREGARSFMEGALKKYVLEGETYQSKAGKE